MINMLTNYSDIYDMYISTNVSIYIWIYMAKLFLPQRESHHFEGWKTSQCLWSCRLLQRRFEFSVGFGVKHISSLNATERADVMWLLLAE